MIRKYKNKFCKHCGESFSPRSAGQFFCSKEVCSVLRVKARRRLYFKKYNTADERHDKLKGYKNKWAINKRRKQARKRVIYVLKKRLRKMRALERKGLKLIPFVPVDPGLTYLQIHEKQLSQRVIRDLKGNIVGIEKIAYTPPKSDYEMSQNFTPAAPRVKKRDVNKFNSWGW